MYIAQEMEAREVLDLALSLVDSNQAELARRLQRSETTVSRWTTGRNGIDFESALRLARMTGLPAQEVVQACGLDPSLVPNAAGDSAQARHDPRLEAFIAQVEDAFHSMTEHEWGVREQAGRALFSVQPIRRANARVEAADKNAEHLQPDLTNEALGKSEPRHLRPGKGKLVLAHGTRWFRLSDSLLAIVQPLLALFTPNRDSGPAAATA